MAKEAQSKNDPNMYTNFINVSENVRRSAPWELSVPDFFFCVVASTPRWDQDATVKRKYKNPQGRTPLMRAIHYRHPDVIRTLGQHKANLDLKNSVSVVSDDPRLSNRPPSLPGSRKHRRATPRWSSHHNSAS